MSLSTHSRAAGQRSWPPSVSAFGQSASSARNGSAKSRPIEFVRRRSSATRSPERLIYGGKILARRSARHVARDPVCQLSLRIRDELTRSIFAHADCLRELQRATRSGPGDPRLSATWHDKQRSTSRFSGGVRRLDLTPLPETALWDYLSSRGSYMRTPMERRGSVIEALSTLNCFGSRPLNATVTSARTQASRPSTVFVVVPHAIAVPVSLS